jgi:hypothetical protein
MEATATAARVEFGVPFEEYLRWEGVSQSALKRMEHSPAHVRHYLDTPHEPTPAMVLGNAIHTAVLEPDKFDMRYAVAPKVDRRTKVGKETWAAFCEENADKVVLSADDAKACKAIAGRLRDKGCGAAPWLLAQGHSEVSFQWTHERTGLLCKGRADRIFRGPKGPVLVDLKSCQNADPGAFSYASAKYGYGPQAAFYLDGLTAATGELHQFFQVIAVEKEAPYFCRVFSLSDETLAESREKYEGWLTQYAECEASGVWPDGSERVVEL